MSKEKIAITGTLDFAATAVLLEELAKSYREKTICIELGAEYICLQPGEYVDVEVEAAVKKGKQKLCIELSWKEELLSDEVKLKISSKAPDAKLVKPEDVCKKEEEEKRKEVPSCKAGEKKPEETEIVPAEAAEDKKVAKEEAKVKDKTAASAKK